MLYHLFALFLFIAIPSDFLNLWATDFSKEKDLAGFNLYPAKEPRILQGDFFDDGFSDWAFQAKDSLGRVHIVFIDEGPKREIRFLGGQEDPFNSEDYSWAQVFKKAEAGEVLWANYIDDYRSFDSVPDSEKLILKYDALYMHLAEACGGGYVYWKDGEFHWLQQE